MARKTETRDVEPAFGRKRLEAARAFLQQARQTEAAANSEYERAAAMSSAILGAIAAADAVCALKLGQVWKGEHSQAHSFLRKVNGAEKAASALQRVVRGKANVQYMAESVTASKLTAALRQADTVVEFAEQVAASS
jgi:hypothetical protein